MSRSSGSSSKTSAGSSSPASTASGASIGSITLTTAKLPGLGTVLVNREGRTLYLPSSERGGKITCNDDNGCAKVWPDTELPHGMTRGIAGSGVRASLLGTAKSASGDRYLTYGGWPLYTYLGDPGPGKGQRRGDHELRRYLVCRQPSRHSHHHHILLPTAGTSSGGYSYP
jgi:predicted lipoprotein with Yx(FWY)xxD motif